VIQVSKQSEPEFESIESFVEFLTDEERTTFPPFEAQKVAENTGMLLKAVVAELKQRGFTPKANEVKAEGRGYTSNNHDRYSEKNGWVGGCGIGNASRTMVQGFQPT
jgi:hypothetical protein